MSQTIPTDIEALQQMRLPELQARYAEIIGEPTRAPNRSFLIRKITEALEAQVAETPEQEPAEAAPGAPQAADTPPDSPPTDQEPTAAIEATSGHEAPQETPLAKLTIPELQKFYFEVLQRETGSSSKSYLIWKIRQAQKGRIPVGPRRRRTPGDAGAVKVLPLRMEADLVARLDEARERLGLLSRMDLLRRALHTYLDQRGEREVAALFAPEA